MKFIKIGKWIINTEQIAYIKIAVYDNTATVIMSNGNYYETGCDIKYILDLIKNAKSIEELEVK